MHAVTKALVGAAMCAGLALPIWKAVQTVRYQHSEQAKLDSLESEARSLAGSDETVRKIAEFRSAEATATLKRISLDGQAWPNVQAEAIHELAVRGSAYCEMLVWRLKPDQDLDLRVQVATDLINMPINQGCDDSIVRYLKNENTYKLDLSNLPVRLSESLKKDLQRDTEERLALIRRDLLLALQHHAYQAADSPR